MRKVKPSSVDRLPPIEQYLENTHQMAQQLTPAPVPLPPASDIEPIVVSSAVPHQAQEQETPSTVSLVVPSHKTIRTARKPKSAQLSQPQHLNQPEQLMQPAMSERTAPLPGPAIPSTPPASGTTRTPVVYPLPPVDGYLD
jgi:hypothetical protein